jgi:hypothetical protein
MIGSVDDVANNEDIVRYVGGRHVDHSTGIVNGSAFDRDQKDDDGLSFTRKAYFSSEENEDDIQIRKVVGSGLKLGKTAVFAQLNVRRALDALAEFEEEIRVVKNPLPANGETLPNPAHALMLGLPFKGEAIGSLKSEVAGDRLRQTIMRTFPAVCP